MRGGGGEGLGSVVGAPGVGGTETEGNLRGHEVNRSHITPDHCLWYLSSPLPQPLLVLLEPWSQWIAGVWGYKAWKAC